MTASWTSWGESRPSLSRQAQALLRSELGELLPSMDVPITSARLEPSRLTETARMRLEEAAGIDAVRVDDATRALHAGGQAYADLVRRRRGDAGDAPDAVVSPTAAGAVGAILRVCADERVAVVPWGGGTSVVGGLESRRGECAAVVALDLGRLDRLLAVDPVSLTATFQPGIRTPAAEAALASHGLTLGHVPQSFERATLGGYVVTRSAGQASSGVGRIDDLVAGLRLTTPVGDLVLPAVSGSAAGPDLRRLVLGSEGTLGVVTEVTLRVRRQPEVKKYDGWMLPSWGAGLEAMRHLAQDGPHPDITRLSDPRETEVSFALAGSGRLTRGLLSGYLRARRMRQGCLLITGYEADPADVSYRRRRTARVLRGAGAVTLGSRVGRAWEHGRFAAPYLRDTMLDAGVLAETLETATTWSTLPDLYAGVRAALIGSLRRAVVGCHVSHLYPTGASLYFTVLAPADPDRTIAQWDDAKRAANNAIVAAGGTITHHHAVGTVHRDHVVRDLGGPVGVELLRAVKRHLDPAGILNPAKLLP